MWLLRLILLVLTLNVAQVTAQEKTPLSFDFIKHPPGELVWIGDTHRLHVSCVGQGDITVLFEAGLGGTSLEWSPVQSRVDKNIKTCAYDRAGYAWSDPSPFPRHAMQIAREADALLLALNISEPVILVGHSFGGLTMRLLAERTRLKIAGLVLIDSSHEDQFARMERAGSKAMMPKGKNFVISPSGVPENLPNSIQRKILALNRMRKNYAAVHAEMSEFRLSAQQVKRHRRELPYPVAVLIRGKDPYLTSENESSALNNAWLDLQQDLVSLSAKGYSVVAENSGHHVHVDEPELVVKTIQELANVYRAAQK